MSVYVNYLHGRESLEDRVEVVRRRIGIEADPWKKVWSFLALLRDKGPVYRFHYEHTLRVSLLCARVADFAHVSERKLFYAGLLHDVGKIQTPVETLGKTTDWTNEDAGVMESHVMDGYRMLKGCFEFTAQVILWHHRFQKKGYHEVLPMTMNCELGEQIMIPLYGRLLSLCDQYDALHRIDGRWGGGIPTGEEIKERMLAHNPDKKDLILRLYGAEIFTTYIDPSALPLV